MRHRTFEWARRAAALLALTAATGCYASAQPAYVEARVAPADVYVYPRAWYDGRPVYLVHDRWYFVDRGRWHYYRDEPRPLYRERRYIQRAPSTARPRGYYDRYDSPGYRDPVRRSAPPARQSAPPARQSAPPARRAR